MLNYLDLQPYQSLKSTFRFKKLYSSTTEKDIYIDPQTNTQYQVTIFNNQHKFSILYSLFSKNVFGNIRGFFKKKNMYYCFADVDGFQTLSAYIQNVNGQKKLISQLFCLQLIEQIATIAKSFEEIGTNIKVISPHSIIVNQNKKGIFKFQLVYPFTHNLFEGLNSTIITREMQFCAPQILHMHIMNNQYDLIRKSFSKAFLYSLGLVLLYCFGYRIKGEERLKANNKEFNIFLKAIRKEIKMLQEGKFISKIIKILLQQNDFVRDNLQTFEIKLHSKHLQSLRKFRFHPKQNQKQTYIPTIYSDHSQQLHKSSLNRTIQIQGSNISNNNKSLMSCKNGVSESNYCEKDLTLFATFKKSPTNYKDYDLNVIGEIKQQTIKDQKKIQIHSPIQIHLDWDDSDSEQEKYSPEKQGKCLENNQNNENYISKQNYFTDEDLRIAVRGLQKIDKQTYSDTKTLNKNIHFLQKSTKSNDAENRQYKDRLQGQIQSKGQLKGEMTIIKQKRKRKSQQQYQVMIQQEPQIIKYSQEQYKIDTSPKLYKKKTSKGSVELQDMTLIEESGKDQEDQDFIQVQERISTNYNEVKKQFTQKSEAIFITLLFSFLIYKIIDFIIQ